MSTRALGDITPMGYRQRMDMATGAVGHTLGLADSMTPEMLRMLILGPTSSAAVIGGGAGRGAHVDGRAVAGR